MPRVSVIMPVYNGEAFIAHAIQSVIAQTYPHWELIVVDDGSTDGTSSIVAGFSDSRIRYIYQENQGLAAARNTGIRAVRGDYVAFLDADDEWYPQFLARCALVMQASERPSLAGVYTSFVHIDENGDMLPQSGNSIVAPQALHARLLEGGFFPPHAALVRADVVKAIGMFDTNLDGQGTEDWDLWLRLSREYTLQGIADPLARYRVSPDSMSTNAASMHDNRMAVLAKHFGPPQGNSMTWPQEKQKAYGFGYRSSALTFMRQDQPDEGWRLLSKAISIWPDLLSRLDTFYELACADQPRGFAGHFATLDLETSASRLQETLGLLFNDAGLPPALHKRRGVAFGNAYLALGLLAYGQRHMAEARRHILQALYFHPPLLCHAQVLAKLVKSLLGASMVDTLKRCRTARGSASR